MDLGVGLPSVIPGAGQELLEQWARSADRGPFSTLGAHDRLAWDGIDCLAALASAAAVTERIGLASLVLIAPLRATERIASDASTIDAIARGRLTLGVGIGPRRDDYHAAGASFGTRGRRLDEQLVELHRFYPGAGRMLVGGGGDAALARMARFSAGYVHGGGPPRAFKGAAERALTAWYEADRPGRPRLVGTAYFALGGRAEEGADFLRAYYRFVGPFSERIAAGLLRTAEEIVELSAGYAEAGCDELVLFPTVADIAQLGMLEAAVRPRD